MKLNNKLMAATSKKFTTIEHSIIECADSRILVQTMSGHNRKFLCKTCHTSFFFLLFFNFSFGFYFLPFFLPTGTLRGDSTRHKDSGQAE